MKIRGAVVVVTGASSGIGRATALALAAEGATLVLTARDREALTVVARECTEAGGEAIVVPADVTRENDVLAVAQRAADTYGRIDAWLNIAGVYLVGRFEDAPPAAFRRVIETNFFGTVNGARAALPYFRRQERGILVNVASVAGAAPQPYASAYVASKFAVRGWSSALRMELAAEDRHGIRICTVLPAAMDTPIFQHAANYSGRATRALDPTYDPQDVAKTIVRLLEHPRREVIVGSIGPAIVKEAGLSLETHERLTTRYYARDQFQNGAASHTDGNLFRTAGPKAIRGGWNPPKRRRRAAFAVAAAVLGVGVLAARRRGKGE
ncbi:MAG TPA: SDR family oxidoreductase [Thermoanaerobaculia bacterium]|nr:SDR family oxidoreductase [Thermoanaerobaculia bacterium]